MGSSEKDPGYFMVRAMNQTDEQFDLFFKKGVVAVGWSKIDFTAFDVEDLIPAVEEVYYKPSDGYAASVVGKKKNEVRRFRSIEKGDRIVVPCWSSVALACACGKRHYDPAIAKTLDLSNQIEAEYIKEDGEIALVPRANLSEGLQRRLRVRGSAVSDLSEFSDEISALFLDRRLTWNDRLEEQEHQRRADFESRLLENIQGGKTNLAAGGQGLERLVEGLLRAEGYTAKILSKREFPGFADADIVASRSDRFGETWLLVQVKHHQGSTDTWGAEQLKEVRRVAGDRYPGSLLVLVTSGEPDAELESYCEKEDITLIGGQYLVSWIVDRLPTLDPAFHVELGISAVPYLIS